MDRIQELLARLAELTAEELDELTGLIAAEVDSIAEETPTVETAEALEALADANDQVETERTRRAEEQAAIDARHAEQLARLRPAEDSADDGEGDAGDGDDEGEGGEGDAEGDQEPEAVAAAGSPPARRPTLADISRRRPPRNDPASRPDAGPQLAATLVASVDVPGFTAGQEITSIHDLATGLERRRDAINGGARGGSKRRTSKPQARGEHVSLATIRQGIPEDRVLGPDARRNGEMIEAAVAELQGGELEALVAAGGLCAPVENVYDVEVLGVTDRPVRDSLVGFQADRGGVNLRPALNLTSWNDAVGVWDHDTDADPGTAVKARMRVICPQFEDSYTAAVTLQLEFSNVTARTDPEGTAANVRGSQVAWARFAENRLLQLMANESVTLTGGSVHGAARDLLLYLDRSIAYYRSRHRLGDGVRLRSWQPRWVRDMIRADLLQGEAFTLELLRLADSEINAFFAARNTVPVWHLDGRVSAETGPPAIAAQTYGPATQGSAVPAFPAQVEQIVAREGDFLFLDGGELDLGLVRDSELNSVNDYVTFFEAWEGIAFRGAEALRIVSTVEPTGRHANVTVAPPESS